MKQINKHLFVYGTLLNGNNSYAAYLQKHCRLIGDGKLKGLLYDMGEYPGVIADPQGNKYVYGSIYLMDEPDKVLEFIDDYEGFGDNQDQPNLFIRVPVTIETINNVVECWVYVYNLPVDGLLQIASGRYTK
ncbi:gamma-glutamylcyclotransferase family protein [Mucilaginibacter sp. SP1R1]|uniref:gamma-glutamylcyclotransferase family protein n=1 Tax=Mucilaginibacter sp. SP1R1 TaxID=2723091 RepID=UPI0016219C17|nr:gamma-glutamylcyclotransferase family protein [Mucilaginibacter sp. SP1R1]MBB6150504.1 gamma-glutamylcyclotransferase (GGCT)/AIG2-like uncharacterized protein YtfP [Mucilaginibacter sp. SP1R1]